MSDTSARRGRTSPGTEVAMESVVVALMMGVLTLAGVIVPNSRGRAIMEVKIGSLTRQVERHNRMVECTCALEQDVSVV